MSGQILSILQAKPDSLQREKRETHGKTSSLVSSNRVIQTSGKKALFVKRRSFWFVLAKQRFKNLLDSGSGVSITMQQKELAEIESCFLSWKRSYSRKYVHLSKKNTHVFIKQYSRFDADYRQNIKRKLRFLDFMLWDLKIELTIDPKNFWHFKNEFVLLSKGWNKLRSWIRKRYGDFEYFWVCEITKKGRPHLHVLISGIKYIPQKDLSEIWQKYGMGKVVYIKKVYNRENLKATAYVLKYVNKTLRNNDNTYASLLFASNKRLYGMSRGCYNLINAGKPAKTKKGFSYEGSVLETDLECFCEEKQIALGFYLRVEVEITDYYEFREVFDNYGKYG